MNRARLSFAAAPVLVAAGVGGLGARDAPATYGRLTKPSWAPPAGAFGPVWSALYVTIGIAGWRIAARGSSRTRGLHLGQLALNTVWPGVFFAAGRRREALAIILALDLVLTTEIVALRDEDPVAAGLLSPYLAWCVFATALNAAVGDPD